MLVSLSMDKNQLKQQIIRDVRAALAEDIGNGDVTAALIEDKQTAARLICREAAILCGTAWFEECFRQLATVTFDRHVADGEWVKDGDTVSVLRGPVRALLSAERSAINFMQTLSATATAAARWRQLAGDAVLVVDTRKTLPLLRQAQKYAVRVGGAKNHRMGLYDEILIKENHISSGGGIIAVLSAAFAQMDKQWVQIEVQNMDELQQAIAAGACRILLDNFSVPLLKQAVVMAQTASDHIELEASGNINEQNIAAVAATGVARISVGAITKNIQAIDFSLLFD